MAGGVAIVGAAVRVPGAAADLDRFWDDVRAAADRSADAPAGRWHPPPAAPAGPDGVPHRRGYFLDPFPADPAGWNTPADELAALDPVFHLFLDVGHRAWRDAGPAVGTVDRTRVGAIFGNLCLPTDRFNGVAREVLRGDRGAGGHPDNRSPVARPVRRLADSLGLGGPAFALDAACASTLYAIKLGCDELLAGRADAMLVGGGQRTDPRYTQTGFARLRALSASGRCAPLDRSADGLMVGEGGGAFVLKRLEDAERNGDRIYAVVRGCGLSNDTGGDVLAPAVDGQVRAMTAAYQAAGWAPRTVGLVECHATGTPVGDAVELASLRRVWGDDWEPGRCVLGSVKATVGHLLTGAGATGVAKVLGAFATGTRFPQPNVTASVADGPFRLLSAAEPWDRPAGHPRRAAVSGFGFGGINAHLLLEEYEHDARRAEGVSPPSPQNGPSLSPIAIVGLAAQFGGHASTPDACSALLRADTFHPIDHVDVPVGRYRVPPAVVADMLPQQALALAVCGDALADAGVEPGRPADPRAGVFLGVALDPNTANFHLRWAAQADGADGDAVCPPLSADRTLGGLASVAASRVGRAFGFGGPGFVVADDEASAARAVDLAVKALRLGEIDRAVAGGVDFAADPRSAGGSADGAAAVVLKRLADAERDGDRVYAVLRDGAEPQAAVDPVPAVGAAAAAAGLVAAVAAVRDAILPGPGGPRFWLADADDGPRTAAVAGLVVSEYTGANRRPPEPRPLGDFAEAVFAVEADTPAELAAGLDRLGRWARERADEPVARLARRWLADHPQDPQRRRAVTMVARSAAELADQAAFAKDAITARPDVPIPDPAAPDPRPAVRDRVFYSVAPVGPAGKLAVVFPGSGNHFAGMGRDLSAAFPDVLRRQQRENKRLRGQYAPDAFWAADLPPDVPAKALLFGQVAHGTLAADVLAAVGVRADALIGLSLGESAGLFALRVWADRDGMFRRVTESPLFGPDLGPPYRAAQQAWGLADGEPVDWVTAVLAAPADDIRASLDPAGKAYLLIVDTPTECVVGGLRTDVEALAAKFPGPFVPLAGVTLAHCEAGRPVEGPYRDLHTLPTTPPPGLTVYSGAWGRRYEPTEARCAGSLAAGLVGPIDFPAVIDAAYADGVRAFVEAGPGASCTRMISAILAGRPHLARAVTAPRQDAVSLVLRLIAQLVAERLPAKIESSSPHVVTSSRPGEPGPRPTVTVPVVRRPAVTPTPADIPTPSRNGKHGPPAVPAPAPAPDALALAVVTAQAAVADAHGAFLRTQDEFVRTADVLLRRLAAAANPAHPSAVLAPSPLVGDPRGTGGGGVSALATPDASTGGMPRTPHPSPPPQGGRGPEPEAAWGAETSVPNDTAVPRAFDTAACLTFARGKIADVLGPLFAEVDAHPTRVRLPDGPLMLVDRILSIEGEPKSLTGGRIVTEHTVRPDRWYLDAGRIPTSVAVESGQADLFLSAFLGIDFVTKGLAVYRLIDAVVTFHRGLPSVGDTITYDIHIDRFVRQGDTWLFRFRFEAAVGGRPLMSMADGVAGFFTPAELAAGQGVVPAKLPAPAAQRPADWAEYVPPTACSLGAAGVDALRRGDLAAAFGPHFAAANLRSPAPLPGGMLRLVDRCPAVDPTGGRYHMGFVRAEYDIHPDDWFLTCHFVDDQVMPGTLMYECCLHTLRILLMKMGWVGEAGQVAVEPVPGVRSRLKCRGQVTASTAVVAYEVTVKRLGYGPEPFAVADALMFADGKPIVEITDLSARLAGLSRDTLDAIWDKSPSRQVVKSSSPGPGGHKPAVYDKLKLLAYSNGNPSEAFGEPYRVFDAGRVLARLPGPPFLFVDRVTAVAGEPFVLAEGASCECQYDVPRDAWYFAANRCDNMPFAVLLEVALQPCGWLAAYCGSALTSDADLSFRNLGGKATQHRPVGPAAGTLTMTATLTRSSRSAGMLIQHYDIAVADAIGPVYDGTTYFGFFTKDALANQVGMPQANVPTVSDVEPDPLPHDPPFPDRMLRMVDRVDGYDPAGGAAGLGLVRGRIAVDPGAWFFQAHFYQDPVWPGSLGLESFLQLLKYAAWKRWGDPGPGGWQAVAPGRPHDWTYRGQVLPTDGEVTVTLEVTAADAAARRLTAGGYLSVDGRVIYHMAGFTLEWNAGVSRTIPHDEAR